MTLCMRIDAKDYYSFVNIQSPLDPSQGHGGIRESISWIHWERGPGWDASPLQDTIRTLDVNESHSVLVR